MASEKIVGDVVDLLFTAPLANKPKPMANQTEIEVIRNTVRIFALTFSDIDDALLKAAVVNHIATEKWFPSVADIRTQAASIVNRADDTPDAFTAWQQIKTALRGGQAPHPMAQKAIDTLGGLREFGQSDLSDEPSWRARFIQAYQTFQQRHVEDTMMLPAVKDYITARQELNGGSIAGLISDVANGKRMESNRGYSPGGYWRGVEFPEDDAMQGEAVTE